MNWILDGAVAAIILGCAVAAWRKGLIRAVLGFLPMALALLGTKAVSPFIGRFLRETILFDKMSTAIQTSMGLDTALQEGAMQTQTALIEAMPLPEFPLRPARSCFRYPIWIRCFSQTAVPRPLRGLLRLQSAITITNFMKPWETAATLGF